MNKKYVPLSLRMGRRSIPQLELHDAPEELRASLWNVIEPVLWNVRTTEEFERRAQWVFSFHGLRWPTHQIPGLHHTHNTTKALHKWFMEEAPADDVYDFADGIPRMVIHGVEPGLDSLEDLIPGSTLHAYARGVIRPYAASLNQMLERE